MRGTLPEAIFFDHTGHAYLIEWCDLLHTDKSKRYELAATTTTSALVSSESGKLRVLSDEDFKKYILDHEDDDVDT